MQTETASAAATIRLSSRWDAEEDITVRAPLCFVAEIENLPANMWEFFGDSWIVDARLEGELVAALKRAFPGQAVQSRSGLVFKL